MGKYISGKASILAIIAVVAVFGFLLSRSINLVSAGSNQNQNQDNHSDNDEHDGDDNRGHATPTPTPHQDEHDDHDEHDEHEDNDCKEHKDREECKEHKSPSPTPKATPTPIVTPTVTPTPTATPTTEVFKNDGGDGLGCATHDCSGNTVGSPQAQGGQVLGASTMAGAGSFDGALYQAIMGFGGIITSFGLKKALRKGN